MTKKCWFESPQGIRAFACTSDRQRPAPGLIQPLFDEYLELFSQKYNNRSVRRTTHLRKRVLVHAIKTCWEMADYLL